MQIGGANVVQNAYICSAIYNNTPMERIIIFSRTTKAASESMRVRFRLRDGREVDLYHKSGITTTPAVLAKFNPDGTLKPKVTNVDPDLVDEMATEIAAMRQAYRKMLADGLPVSGKGSADVFEALVNRQLHPGEGDGIKGKESLLQRLRRYIDEAQRDGLFGTRRSKGYNSLFGKMERFLTINGRREMIPARFDDEMLMGFRQFVFDEYLYTSKWPGLYTGISERNTPTRQLTSNTVAMYMKALQAFFTDLENKEEVARSPFRRLGKQRRHETIRERYSDPVYLYKDEFLKVLATDVPASLQPTKDAFLVQCAFGFRISDFQALTMDNLAVSKDGIPYIHYWPIKTRNTQPDRHEVETPALRFAFDILMGCRCSFPLLTYVSGKSGYNAKIKDLLRVCGIDRRVTVSSADAKQNEYKRLWEVASSKICRKTHIDMLNKVQIDMYAAGLHRQGSAAVNRYTKIELQDRFALLCAAFGQEPYKVNQSLKVIE